MNISELISFLGKNRISLCTKQNQIHYRSSIKIPANVLISLKETKPLFINALKRYEDREVIISPLSYNQQSLWFTYLLSPHSQAYNVAIPMQILSPIDPKQVSNSLNLLIGCHDQLRATFDMISDDSVSVPCQYITNQQNCNFSVTDVSNLSDDQIRDSAEAFYSKPFTLSDSPPFRTALFSRTKSEHILIFLFHHIICDAQSIGIFLNNFNSLYCNCNITSFKATPYTDFVGYQLQYLNEHQDQLHNYWKTKFNCAKGNLLTPDFDRKKSKSYNGESIFFNINKEISQRVLQLSNSLSITPFSFYFGCFQLLYMLRSGSFDATIGVLSHSRSRSEFNNTIGYFVNPLPLFCNRSENTSISDHLKRSHRDICELLDNQNYPFLLMVEQLSPDRNADRPVLFSAIFNMLSKKQLGMASTLVYPDTDASEMTFGGMCVKPYRLNQQEGQFDVTMELLERDEHIQGIFKYDSDLFTFNWADQLTSQYNLIISEAINSINIPIHDLFDKIRISGNMGSESTSWYLSIAATFTANILDESFQFWENVTGVHITCDFSPYYQIEQYLLDPAPKNAGYKVFLLRLEDLTYQTDLDSDFDMDYIRKRAFDLCGLLIKTANEQTGQFIVCFCPQSMAVLNNQELSSDFIQLEKSLISEFDGVQRLCCITSEQLLQSLNHGTDYEPSVGIIGQVPYTEYFFEMLGAVIIRAVYAFEKQPCKAIVVDCDNTLWLGVAGEDSISQITIPEQMRTFQQFLKNCTKKGVPLCLCSKNNRDDVISVFEGHPDMVLSMSDISFDRINWQPKSLNILEIAHEANLTISGIIFIDDSPAECAEVSANCPDVTTIHLPSSLNDRLVFIKNFWAFDTLKVTNEDLSRLEKYNQEKSRTAFRNNTTSFSDFIAGLNLQINIRNATSKDISRISQLSYRTNQFTNSSKRLSEEQVGYFCEQNDCFVIEVSDRFGDYGLVGALIGEKVEDTYNVNTFFLSCRSLGRGVEHRCLSFIGTRALKLDCNFVKISVYITAKNKPFQLFMHNSLSFFQTSTDSMLLYQMPNDVLQKVAFNPAEYEQQKPPANLNKDVFSTNSALFSFSTSLLEKIATVYSTTQSLHQQILMFRKLKRSSQNALDKSMFPPDESASTEIEEVIHKIWSESLGKDHISIHQNFFDAGGRSIILPHIVQKIQHYLYKTVSLVELFQYPTISSLAAHLTAETFENNCNDISFTRAEQQKNAYSRFKSQKKP